MQINFKKGNQFFYIGNKTRHCTGLEMFLLGDNVKIHPVGKRGNALDAGFDIPMDSLQDVINSLQWELEKYNLSGQAGAAAKLCTIMETAELRGCGECGQIQTRYSVDDDEAMSLYANYVDTGEDTLNYSEVSESIAQSILEDALFLEWAENNQLLDN